MSALRDIHSSPRPLDVDAAKGFIGELLRWISVWFKQGVKRERTWNAAGLKSKLAELEQPAHLSWIATVTLLPWSGAEIK